MHGLVVAYQHYERVAIPCAALFAAKGLLRSTRGTRVFCYLGGTWHRACVRPTQCHHAWTHRGHVPFAPSVRSWTLLVYQRWAFAAALRATSRAASKDHGFDRGWIGKRRKIQKENGETKRKIKGENGKGKGGRRAAFRARWRTIASTGASAKEQRGRVWYAESLKRLR